MTIKRHNVGDIIVITPINYQNMKNGNASIHAYPSNSYMEKIKDIFFRPQLKGTITNTFPPGYEVTADFHGQAFHMKDDYITNIKDLDKYDVKGLGITDGDNGTPHPIVISVYANDKQEAQQIIEAGEGKAYKFERIESIEVVGEHKPNQFRNLNVGDKFDFVDDRNIGYNSFFHQCEKVAERKYKDSDGEVHTIGSTRANVYHVERTQEKTKGISR